MAKGKYYVISLIVVILSFLGVSFGYCGMEESYVLNGKRVFPLRSADKDVCKKINEEPEKDGRRFEDTLVPEPVSISKLERELGKKVVYKGREIAEDKGLWYLEYPFRMAVSAIETLEDFRDYLSRMVNGKTDIELSDDEVSFQIKKKF